MEYYRDLPLLILEPDFADLPKITLQRGEVQSSSGNRTVSVYNTDNIIRKIKHKYIFQNTEDLEYMEEFLDEVKGRAGEFWVMSWTNDLTYISNSNDGVNVVIKDCNYRNVYYNKQQNNIFILNTQGELYVGNVVSVSYDDNKETLIVEPPLSNTFNADNTIIGFTYKMRLANDIAAITVKEGVKSIDLDFVEILPIQKREYVNYTDKRNTQYEYLRLFNSQWSGDLQSTVIPMDPPDDPELLYMFIELTSAEWSGSLDDIVENVGPITYNNDDKLTYQVEWSGVLNDIIVDNFYNNSIVPALNELEGNLEIILDEGEGGRELSEEVKLTAQWKASLNSV